LREIQTIDSNPPPTPSLRGGVGGGGSNCDYLVNYEAAKEPEVNGKRRNRRSIWSVQSEPLSEAHFATFPTKLIEPCVLAGSGRGDFVIDPFFGSGTTGVVAALHGRNFIGIELKREYVEIAQSRLAAYGFSFNLIETQSN
jgi:site-specific DNA-methyltransferase (adenine-specific)